MIIEQGLNLGQAFRRKLPSFRERISRVQRTERISAVRESAPLEVQEQVFARIERELLNKSWFDYGDIGSSLLYVAELSGKQYSILK